MTDDIDDWKCPPLSHNAVHIYAVLDRRGRSMRLHPLQREAGLDQPAFATAINELQERCWVYIIWRKRPEHTDADASRPMRDVERILATKFGRFRFPQTRPTRRQNKIAP